MSSMFQPLKLHVEQPSLYLPSTSSEKGPSQILEVQAVSPSEERSWFVDNNVIADGRLLMLTPVDPAFLLYPLLTAVFPPLSPSKEALRTMEDIFELVVARLISSSASDSEASQETLLANSVPSSTDTLVSPTLPHPSIRTQSADGPTYTARDIQTFSQNQCVAAAMQRICETKDASPDVKLYRYSHEKFMALIRAKVAKLAAPEVFASFPTLHRNLARSGLAEHAGAEGCSEELANLARSRAACETIAQYLDPLVAAQLEATYDFSSLDAYLAAAAPVADTLPEGFSGVSAKGSFDGAGKRGKKGAPAAAAGAKKKAPAGSRGVEKLKKVDTKNMSKLSTFFAAKSKT